MEMALEWLLRIAWISGTLPILLALLPLPGSPHLRRIISIFGNRGKTVSSSVKRFLVPQSYFLHFYIVGVLWTAFLLLCAWCYALEVEVPLALVGLKTHFASAVEGKVEVWKIVFMLLLMEIQVMRRLYESIFVFNYNSSAKMHTIGYLVGLFFYTAAPLSIFRSASREAWHYILGCLHIVAECQTGLSWSNHVKPLTKLGWCQWIGAAIFSWGSVHQYHCHAILGSVRKQAGADKYVVAKGDWFELVSCPHYLAEIVIYVGILICSGGSDLTMWLLVAFVVTNLTFAAAETHKWYRRKFENYPSSRCAIFPWIF